MVILDHHNVENAPNFPGVVIVNNQLSPNFSNKALSGAGIVYKTIQAYSEIYNIDSKIYQKYADLAALGIVADMMDTRTLDNNYIIQKGLNKLITLCFEQFSKQQFSSKGVCGFRFAYQM